MAMRVTVRVRGVTELDRKLKTLGDSLYKFQPAMKQIGTRVGSFYANEVFASQGGALGKRWQALAVSTVKDKIRDGYRSEVNRPLERTGIMRRSFKATTTQNSVTIENTIPYFKYHQSSEPRSKIPYRPMMAINDNVMSIVKEVIEADVRQKLDALA